MSVNIENCPSALKVTDGNGNTITNGQVLENDNCTFVVKVVSSDSTEYTFGPSPSENLFEVREIGTLVYTINASYATYDPSTSSFSPTAILSDYLQIDTVQKSSLTLSFTSYSS